MIEISAILHLLFFGVFLPVAGVRAIRNPKVEPEGPKRALFISIAVNLLIFGVLSLLVAWNVGIQLFPVWKPTFAEIGLAIGVLALTLWSRTVAGKWIEKDSAEPKVELTPDSRSDLGIWAVISLFAGFFEEIIYRAVLYSSFARITQSEIAGAVLSAAAFGLSHVQQGWKAAAYVFGLALVFQSMVAYGGNLYMAMLVHAVCDFLAGIQAVRERERKAMLKGLSAIEG